MEFVRKGSLVRTLPSYGRWSWFAFTPSCWPHHHVNHPSSHSWEVYITLQKRVNSRVKTLSGAKPCIFWGNVAPGIAEVGSLFPRLRDSIWQSCRQKVHRSESSICISKCPKKRYVRSTFGRWGRQNAHQTVAGARLIRFALQNVEKMSCSGYFWKMRLAKCAPDCSERARFACFLNILVAKNQGIGALLEKWGWQNSLTRCFSNSLIDFLTYWFAEPLIHCSVDPVIHWFNDWLNRWIIDFLIQWFIAPLIHRLIQPMVNHWWFHDSLNRRIIDSLIPWFSDSLTHWFTGSLIRWVIDSISRSIIDLLVHWFVGPWFIDSLIHWPLLLLVLLVLLLLLLLLTFPCRAACATRGCNCIFGCFTLTVVVVKLASHCVFQQNHPK